MPCRFPRRRRGASPAGRCRSRCTAHGRRSRGSAGRRPEHPDRPDRRRRARACRARSAVRCTPRRWTRSSQEGVAYNRFHTTAMCSPTRASLLTGRNHHRVGNGQIAELANDWDGYSGPHPEEQRAGRRGAEGLRLQHRRLGQVAQHAGRGDDRRRPVRELADGSRLRVLLRLPRRRGVAVRAEPGAQHDGRAAAEDRRRRATTSARTSPTTPSAGCASTRRSSPTSRSSCTGPAAACTARTTS